MALRKNGQDYPAGRKRVPAIIAGSRSNDTAIYVRAATSMVVGAGESRRGLSARHHAGNALAEADCTVQQIMAITGHKTWKEAIRYTQRREQRKLAQQAMDKLETATKGGKPKN